MHGKAQVICVMAIGLGSGFFAAGHYLEPPLSAMTPTDLARVMSGSSDLHITAGVLRGVGTCLLTTGGLGIVIPWINALVYRFSSRNTPSNS